MPFVGGGRRRRRRRRRKKKFLQRVLKIDQIFLLPKFVKLITSSVLCRSFEGSVHSDTWICSLMRL
jgi:hypothetical protein